jgi:hypothetical protein
MCIIMNRPSSHETSRLSYRRKSRLTGILVLAVVAALGSVFLVQANTDHDKMAAPSVRYTWSAPSNGTPVVSYKAEVLVNDRDLLIFEGLQEEAVTIQVDFGNKYLVRVAAVDAADMQGPWSSWSLAYAPELDPPTFNP